MHLRLTSSRRDRKVSLFDVDAGKLRHGSLRRLKVTTPIVTFAIAFRRSILIDLAGPRTMISLNRIRFLTAIALVSLTGTLAVSSATADVWTVPDISDIGALAVDLDPVTPGLIALQWNRVVHISVSAEFTVLAGDIDPGFAEGIGSQARFDQPESIAVARDGSIIIADTKNNRIRKLDRKTRQVTTLAGSEPGFADGKADKARFHEPTGIAIDSSQNIIIADRGNSRIRKLAPNGNVETIAAEVPVVDEQSLPDGQRRSVKLNGLRSIAIDRDGMIFITDSLRDQILKLNRVTGDISAVAGSTRGFVDGKGSEAKFHTPMGIAIASDGSVLISDWGNSMIRRLDPKTGDVTRFAGNGVPGTTDGEQRLEAKFEQPRHIAVWPSGGIFISQAMEHLRFIAPPDSLEKELLKLLSDFNAFGPWPEHKRRREHERSQLEQRCKPSPLQELSRALTMINPTAPNFTNYLELMPKDLRDEMVTLFAINEIDRLRSIMTLRSIRQALNRPRTWADDMAENGWRAFG